MLKDNPLFSGGLSLMMVRSAAALLRHPPAQVWSIFQRRFSITIEPRRIEDVDYVFKTERTTSDQTGMTLSGLLNALDGVSSREGRISFLTTNHPERRDAALVRSGWVDKKIELGNATRSQARRIYGWFYQGYCLTDARIDELAERFASQVTEGKVCMAAVQEHRLRHRGSPEAEAREVDFGDAAPIASTNGKPTAALVEAST